MGIRTCFISGLALPFNHNGMYLSDTNSNRNQEQSPGRHREHSLETASASLHSKITGPLVTYEVWFKVGSGESASAQRKRPRYHGIEPLLRTHDVQRDTEEPRFSDSVYAMGGKLNAWTWLDATVLEKIPSRHLPTIIEYEADRLENMQMDFLNLEPEREVVKSERLLRTENSAYGAMSEVMDATAFRTHPYHWPTGMDA